jgi:hypothetical protein
MTYVRRVLGVNADGSTDRGEPFMCCWNDCTEKGHEEIKVVVPNGMNQYTREPQTLTYIFCSRQHRMYYVNSHKDLGNLPANYRATPGILRR